MIVGSADRSARSATIFVSRMSADLLANFELSVSPRDVISRPARASAKLDNNSILMLEAMRDGFGMWLAVACTHARQSEQ